MSVFLTIACSKKTDVISRHYSLEEIELLASREAKVMIPSGEFAISYGDYSLGLDKTESKTLVYKRIKFFAIKFINEETAKNEAIRLNQYYSRNYLFDRVEGEPVLEDYVIKTFGAINPNRKVQRESKQSAPSAPEAHDSKSAPSAHH
jgi:hypothetical protein